MPKILVTGSSSGIGYEICNHLLEHGFEVVGLSRNPASFSNDLYTPYPLDLSRLDDTACKKLLKQIGPIDGLICNAGYGRFAHLEEFSLAQIQEMIQVNFLSHVYLTRYFLPYLKKKTHSNLIFIGSEAALLGKKKGSIYCASKFALRGFSQAIRDECSTTNVRVSILQIGMTNTPFFDKLNFEPKVFLTPKQVAEAVLMVLKADSSLVFDEIVLSPIKKSIYFKNSKK